MSRHNRGTISAFSREYEENQEKPVKIPMSQGEFESRGWTSRAMPLRRPNRCFGGTNCLHLQGKIMAITYQSIYTAFFGLLLQKTAKIMGPRSDQFCIQIMLQALTSVQKSPVSDVIQSVGQAVLGRKGGGLWATRGSLLLMHYLGSISRAFASKNCKNSAINFAISIRM
jgi:hypothetical protein